VPSDRQNTGFSIKILFLLCFFRKVNFLIISVPFRDCVLPFWYLGRPASVTSCTLSCSHSLSFACADAPHDSASRAASGPHRCAADCPAPSPIISSVTSSGQCTAVTCSIPVTSQLVRQLGGLHRVKSASYPQQQDDSDEDGSGCQTLSNHDGGHTQVYIKMWLLHECHYPPVSITKSCHFAFTVRLVSVTAVERRHKENVKWRRRGTDNEEKKVEGKGRFRPIAGHEGPERAVKVQLYLFFNLGATSGWLVNATPRPLYPQERD
jgi:hypothetical protein